MLALYRGLIALRAAEPELATRDLTRVPVDYDEDERWLVVHRGGVPRRGEPGGRARTVPVAGLEVVLATGSADTTEVAVTLSPQSAAVLRRAL